MQNTPRASEIALLRETVATGCRVLAAHGHDDFIWGHVSVRDPEGRGVWMKGAALGFHEVTAEDVILVGFDGEVIMGDRPRHSEWPIHTELMLTHPQVGAVVHTHPPHCIALGASAEPLRPVSHAGTLFVPPDVPRFTKTSDLIVTRELGADVAATLTDQSALLLVNHGIVTAGRAVSDAIIRAVLLEQAARHQMLTQSAGGVKVWTGDEEATRKRATAWPDRNLAMFWEYLVRTVAPAHEPRRSTSPPSLEDACSST